MVSVVRKDRASRCRFRTKTGIAVIIFSTVLVASLVWLTTIIRTSKSFRTGAVGFSFEPQQFGNRNIFVAQKNAERDVSASSAADGRKHVRGSLNGNPQPPKVGLARASKAAMSTPAIPHILIFTYKHDILKSKEPKLIYGNVINTINTYKALWKGDGGDGDVAVHFLDDERCRENIRKAYPDLLQHFNSESYGPFKGDICRIASLYLTGGYYFDVDLAAIKGLRLDDNVTFATVEERTRPLRALSNMLSKADQEAMRALFIGNFFQAFLATSPKHPILEEALHLMQKYYEGKFDIGPSMMGVKTLGEAFKKVGKEKRGVVRLLKELNNTRDQDDPNQVWYPNVPVQYGTGRGCNFIVHDPDERVVYFYSRIVGLSVACT
mmetsp:Transcript_29218/g.63412  ORF Transcript_29218/g.63412 Transcript_29218/m.63412 type:complete len:380 (+) Transcript_29218:130-1269(+)